MIKTRKDLIQAIKTLQRLIPGDDYSMYIKQAQQKYLDYIPAHRFLPAMDEKSPKSLNDVELNVISKARHNYLNNIFIPGIVEKQPHILKESVRETESEAIKRWTEQIKKVDNPDELMKLINNINRRKQHMAKNKQKKSFWQRLLGL